MIRERAPRWVGLWLALASTGAGADVVHFVNGDRLTGTLLESEPELVTVDVPHIGVVAVPRAQVVRLEIDSATDHGAGNASEPVPQQTEPEARVDGMLGGWEGRADLGVVVAAGNTETQDVNFVAGVKRPGKRFDNVLGFAVRKARAKPHLGDEAVTTKDQVDLNYDLRWKYGNAWYAVANFEYFRDPIKNVEQRTTAGAGVGLTFWDSPQGALRTDAGISRVFEQAGAAGIQGSGQAESSANNPALRWGVQYRRWLVVERLELFHNNRLLRILDSERGSVWDSDTGIRFHLNSRWLAALRMDVQHETEPAIGQGKTDSSYAVAVGFKL